MALRALHDQGADSTERVVPEVSTLCQLDSDEYSSLKMGKLTITILSLPRSTLSTGVMASTCSTRCKSFVDPVQKLFVLFTNWGRIGEEGKYQQTPFSRSEAASKEFEKIFKSKTGNSWAERKNFFEKAKKYKLVQTLKTRVKEPEKLLASIIEQPSKPCTLHPSLAETLRFLLNPVH